MNIYGLLRSASVLLFAPKTHVSVVLSRHFSGRHCERKLPRARVLYDFGELASAVLLFYSPLVLRLRAVILSHEYL
jgi:hypothetical protein